MNPTVIVVWRSASGKRCVTRLYAAHANAFCADVRTVGGTVLHTYQEA